jgi:glycosyltransferase involved in cell wall biosynthesis
MNNNRLKAVALIPAYNEEGNIAKVILRAKQYVDKVIVCDDGSSDMTFMIAEALGAKVVRHAERRGKGEAFRTLSKEVMELNPDIIVALDGDGQHDPAEIPMLLKPIEAGTSDVVVGSRYVDGGKMDAPFYRRLGLKAINFLYKKVAGVHVNDTQCGFRAFSHKAFECLIQCDAKGYGIEGEQLALAARNGLRVVEVPISVKYKGLRNNSKKSPIMHGWDLILTLFKLVAEKRPLKYLGLPGMGLTFMGAILGVYLLWMFNITRNFSLPVAMLAIGTFTVGLVLILFAVTLHGLNRINKRLTEFHVENK